MESLPVISSPASEPWVAWVMLGLLVLACTAHAMQPNALIVGFKTLFTAKDRSSAFIDSEMNLRAQMMTIVYAVFAAAMSLYITWTVYLPYEHFSFTTYMAIVGGTTIMAGIRTILQLLTRYTFFSKKQTETFSGHYYYLVTSTAVIQFPILLLSLFWNTLPAQCIMWLNLGVMLFYLLVLLLKMLLIFVHDLKSLLYTILYLLTLEIIPLGGLVAVAKFLIINIQ